MRVCVPGDEKRLVQAVVDIDDEIIVGNGVNIWARKLAVDEYSLKNDQIRSISIGIIFELMDQKLHTRNLSMNQI